MARDKYIIRINKHRERDKGAGSGSGCIKVKFITVAQRYVPLHMLLPVHN